MQIIPLIKIKERYTTNNVNEKTQEFIKELENHENITQIYILDIPGIETNKPNLCAYQKLSTRYDLWIDSGPRNIGDVVDLITAGAEKITIRKNFATEGISQEVKKFTENEIYSNIELGRSFEEINNNSFDSFIEGFVNFNLKNTFEDSYENSTILKQHQKLKPIYTFENDKYNVEYWKKQEIDNFLVELDKYEEFSKNAL